ncbi:MAG TPA: hypothetical protein DCL38_08740 [Lachnospiraceae bacterium]|nr:hypothetical protein [Lachnospiraceae bacterium]
MSKKTGIIVIILSVAAIALSVVSLVHSTGSPDVQYVMYIGTNDKDTNEPICTPDEAKDIVEDVLIDHFGGYTIQEANGGWEDDGMRYKEYSVVAIISDTDLGTVHSAADVLCEKLNQSSILIQTNETKTEFYEGRR